MKKKFKIQTKLFFVLVYFFLLVLLTLKFMLFWAGDKNFDVSLPDINDFIFIFKQHIYYWLVIIIAVFAGSLNPIKNIREFGLDKDIVKSALITLWYFLEIAAVSITIHIIIIFNLEKNNIHLTEVPIFVGLIIIMLNAIIGYFFILQAHWDDYTEKSKNIFLLKNFSQLIIFFIFFIKHLNSQVTPDVGIISIQNLSNILFSSFLDTAVLNIFMGILIISTGIYIMYSGDKLSLRTVLLNILIFPFLVSFMIFVFFTLIFFILAFVFNLLHFKSDNFLILDYFLKIINYDISENFLTLRSSYNLIFFIAGSLPFYYWFVKLLEEEEDDKNDIMQTHKISVYSKAGIIALGIIFILVIL